MLPLYNIHPMSMPIHPQIIGISSAITPMMSIPVTPNLCSSNNINAYTSTEISNKYDSHMYDRCQNTRRDQTHHCHVPFDWYELPKQGYNIIYEDVAVITFDRPVPMNDFNRYYIHRKNRKYYDHNNDSILDESEDYDDRQELSYVNRRRYIRTESNFDDEEEEENTSSLLNHQSTRTNNYITLKPNRQKTTTTSPSSNYQENQSHIDDDFSDTNSINSAYNN
ncbi:unnamed protein product [Rotaria sordida]|uniref:Uncharacterized protein n=1 Tax=Rotaria sordida TaxID=392033 RepID=A0A814X1C1_9BILA|nr:unnamed protein product [Rotaria sordida]CAF1209652.1 unnamed protein product [Rotaria sordida]